MNVTASPLGGLSMWRAWRAVRRWIALPIALGVIGAVIATAVGVSSSSSAQSRLLVQSTTQDSGTMQRLVETAVQQLNTPAIFEAAAAATGADPTDLRSRTRAASVTDSLVMTITVSAADPDEAVAESRAIAAAAISASQARTQAELERLTESTLALLNNPDARANDASAERARITRLGDELAGNQSNLVANSNELVLLDDAEVTGPVIGGKAMAVGCAAGGIMLGLLVALLLGSGRGKLSSLREVQSLYPATTGLAPHQIPTVLALEPAPVETIIVAGVHASAETLESLSNTICDAVVLTGGNAYVSGQRGPVLSPARGADLEATPPSRTNGSAARVGIRAHDPETVSVIATELNGAVIRRAARSGDTLLFIAVEPGKTRLEWLDRYIAAAGERTYLLWPEEAAPWRT